MVKPRYLADDTVFSGLPWIVYSALMIFFCFAVTLRTYTLIRIFGGVAHIMYSGTDYVCRAALRW